MNTTPTILTWTPDAEGTLAAYTGTNIPRWNTLVLTIRRAIIADGRNRVELRDVKAAIEKHEAA